MNTRSIRKTSQERTLKGHSRWLIAAGVLALAALVFGGLALGSSTAQAGPTPEPTPTATAIPGSETFVGTLEAATTPAACGPGTIILTLSGDHTQLLSLEVRDFPVAGTAQNQTIVYEPPADVAADGTFSQSGPLPPPLEAITGTLDGTFDFVADPATVAGTVNIAAGAAVLCDTTFSAVLQAGPSPTPLPTATSAPPATATVAATALPATGDGPTAASGTDGTFLALIAAVAGGVALATAGLAALRRRTA